MRPTGEGGYVLLVEPRCDCSPPGRFLRRIGLGAEPQGRAPGVIQDGGE